MNASNRTLALVLVLAVGTATAAGSTVARATPTGPTDYDVTRLDPLAGGNAAFGAAVVNSGVVAGTSATGHGTTHAVVWRDREAMDLGALGGEEASSAVLWPVKNNSGVVVGISQTDEVDPNNEPWSCDAFLPSRIGFACVGFVWRDGQMTALPTLGGTHGFAASVNNRGQIVGWAETKVSDPDCNSGQVLQFRAVRWDALGARTTELPPLPGDKVSSATGINDAGLAVGISGVCDQAVGRLSARNAVVWDHETPRRLPDLGGIAWNTPMAVNHRGDVVGFLNRSAADGQSFRPMPVLWTADRTLHKLELPDGYEYGQALGINARGEVAGVAYTAAFDCTAVLWRDLNPITLQSSVDDASLDLCAANDINDRGQITGQATERDGGASVGFLASPSK